MKIKIYKNYEELSRHAADEILAVVKQKPKAVLCLAAGDTPRLAYSVVVEKANSAKTSFADCIFVGLDEWLGISPDNQGSCCYFLTETVFNPLKVPQQNIFLFDAMSLEPEMECKKMNGIIQQNGGIDMMLVGIGMNGHIGFNEPGEAFQKYAHVVDLDETSKRVGQKYFTESTVLTRGITLGLGHMLEATKAIVIANGTKKASIVKKALEEEITPRIPASVIRNHHNGYVMLDEDAASLLTPCNT